LRAVARVVRDAGDGADGRRRFAIEFINLPPAARDRIAAFVSGAGTGGSGRPS
jgi:c-di-GMP-binding flagellar brake protein YcgR